MDLAKISNLVGYTVPRKCRVWLNKYVKYNYFLMTYSISKGNLKVAKYIVYILLGIMLRAYVP